MSQEKDVGIVQYANTCEGFTGILRHRCDTVRF
jgi:hypothetical protein